MCVSFMVTILVIAGQLRHPSVAFTHTRAMGRARGNCDIPCRAAGLLCGRTRAGPADLASRERNGQTSLRTGGFHMRIIMSGLFCGLLGCVSVASASPCAKAPDVTAFDVAGLKAKLMVTAITCN